MGRPARGYQEAEGEARAVRYRLDRGEEPNRWRVEINGVREEILWRDAKGSIRIERTADFESHTRVDYEPPTLLVPDPLPQHAPVERVPKLWKRCTPPPVKKASPVEAS